LPKCKVDQAGSRAFRKQIKDYSKRYPRIGDDVAALIRDLEADYQSLKLHPFRFQVKEHAPELHGRIWKYDMSSSDMGKGPRRGFRVYGVFLEDVAVQVPTMRLFLIYYKGDTENVSAKEVAKLVEKLREDLASADAADPFVGAD